MPADEVIAAEVVEDDPQAVAGPPDGTNLAVSVAAPRLTKGVDRPAKRSVALDGE